MQHRTLGTTDLAIAPLVLGGNVFGWTADEETSFRILDAALDRGLNEIEKGQDAKIKAAVYAAIKKDVQKTVAKRKPAPADRIAAADMKSKLKVRVHTVRKGETLWGICQHYYKNPWNWLSLYKTNGEKITDPDTIYPGQKILVPILTR